MAGFERMEKEEDEEEREEEEKEYEGEKEKDKINTSREDGLEEGSGGGGKEEMGEGRR